MSQPNKRQEQDNDPRTSESQGSPLESSNPTSENLQRPNSDKGKITEDKNLNTSTEEDEETLEDTSGAA